MNLTALIQSVRDGDPVQVDPSIALRMIVARLEDGLSDIRDPQIVLRVIAAKISEGLRQIPDTEDTEPIRGILFDIMDIIDHA